MNDEAKVLQRLFESARAEAPTVGAKARALATATAATTAAGASAGAAASTALPKIIAAAAALAALAGGVALSLHVWPDRGASPRRAASSVDEPITPEPPAPTSPPRAPHTPARGANHTAPAVTTCADVSIADAEPRVCSTPGEPLLIELVNTCSTETMDVYWINYQCKEVFQRQLAPGETHHLSTFATHPFRIRNHATHRLLKEIAVSGPTISEGDDSPLVARWKRRTHKHDVVIKPSDEAIERDDARCSEAGVPLDIEVTNERKEAVEMYWFDYDCNEVFKGRVEAGERWKQRTQDAHRWRVRDGQTHKLVKEFAISADAGAERTYVTVP